MAKAVGLSRNIKLTWLNKTVELLEENLPERAFKEKLNEYLGFEIKSAINLRKTREILMKIWFYEEEEITDIRKMGIALLKKYPEFSMAIHWCMILLTYPVFADICALISRITDFQDDFTIKLVRQKLFDEWGERTTVYHSIDKIIATMLDLDAIERQAVGVYRVKKHKVKNEHISLYMVHAAMKITERNYYTFSELKNFNVLFPFDYITSKEDIMLDDRFEINTFGGEVTVSIK